MDILVDCKITIYIYLGKYSKTKEVYTIKIKNLFFYLKDRLDD